MRPAVLLIACDATGIAQVEHSLIDDDIAIVRGNGTREGLELAARGAPELVVVVAERVDVEATALVRRLRSDRHTADVPVLVVADGIASRSAVQALELGAVDVLPSAIDPLELRARVRMTLRDKRRNDEILESAGVDALTRLGNGRHLERRLDEELDVWDRYHRDVSLVLVEVDGLAALEEDGGLALAEGVVLRATEVLRASVRSTDALFHRGGGRFAAVLRETPGSGAMIFAERVRQRIDALGGPTRTSAQNVSVSIGVGSTAHWRMAGSDLRGRLQGEANAALLRARLAGGNRCELGGPAEDRLLATG
ncbi:MAG TPA: diguanylate cyclase [Nannocystaceae bacterium]|nr:diguanylate cyclase [Nannocystaceae bacterium]